MSEPKKVLVIDDDKTVHLALKEAFESAGFSTYSVLDGIQGLMRARQLQPDLIVLDLMLPAGGGFSLFERLQQMTDVSSLPILVYSARPRDEVLQKIREGPKVAVVQKPSPSGAILAAARRLLGGGNP